MSNTLLFETYKKLDNTFYSIFLFSNMDYNELNNTFNFENYSLQLIDNKEIFLEILSKLDNNFEWDYIDKNFFNEDLKLLVGFIYQYNLNKFNKSFLSVNEIKYFITNSNKNNIDFDFIETINNNDNDIFSSTLSSFFNIDFSKEKLNNKWIKCKVLLLNWCTLYSHKSNKAFFDNIINYLNKPKKNISFITKHLLSLLESIVLDKEKYLLIFWYILYLILFYGGMNNENNKDLCIEIGREIINLFYHKKNKELYDSKEIYLHLGLFLVEHMDYLFKKKYKISIYNNLSGTETINIENFEVLENIKTTNEKLFLYILESETQYCPLHYTIEFLNILSIKSICKKYLG